MPGSRDVGDHLRLPGHRRHVHRGVPLERRQRHTDGDRADRPRHGRACGAVPQTGRGARRRRLRRLRRRPPWARSHGRLGGGTGRSRAGRLERARLRPRHVVRVRQGRAAGPAAGADRPQHGFVRAAAAPARPQRRPRRSGALRHVRARRDRPRHRPQRGDRPECVQRAVRAADRLRVAEPRRGRGRCLRRRSRLRLRARSCRSIRLARRGRVDGRSGTVEPHPRRPADPGDLGRGRSAGRWRRADRARREPLPRRRRAGRDREAVPRGAPRDLQRDQPRRGHRRRHRLASASAAGRLIRTLTRPGRRRTA